MAHPDYRRLAHEAALQAGAARDPLSAATLRYDAARRIPRFPSLLPLHFELLWPVVSDFLHEVAPGLWADASVFLTRVGLLAGVVDAAEEVAEHLEAVARVRADERLRACASLSRGLVLVARERLPGAEAEFRHAEAVLEADPVNGIWVQVARAALSLSAREESRAEQRLKSLLDALPPGPEWDGERYDAWQKQAFLFMQSDRVDEAIRALEDAHRKAREHRALPDAWLSVVSLTPMLLVTDGAARAVEMLDEALGEVAAAGDGRAGEAPAGMEMALHNLKMRALERLGDLGQAIQAGFKAIERCGVVGTLDDYAMFIVEVASLYQRAGSAFDAYHVLALARKGLRERGSEAAATVQAALDALRDDLGTPEYDRLAAEAARLNPTLEGEEP